MFSSILYLFNETRNDDELAQRQRRRLGGTLFFEDLEPVAELPRKFAPAYANCTRFACVGQIDAEYNRAAVYPAWQLHAADVPDDDALSADAALGRLTITSMYYMQRRMNDEL